MKSLKRAVKWALGTAGLTISKSSSESPARPKGRYGGVGSTAHYTPWYVDGHFRDCYETIREFTLVDERRCYCLWSMVEQVSKLSEGAIVEIGVWRGGSGGLLARRARECGIREKVYLCDTFQGVVKAGDKDPSYTGGEHADTSLATAQGLLFETLKLDNVHILQGIFPDDTGKELEEMRFRLCHVDVDVYQSAKDIIEWVYPRMVKGGVVVFDDYGFDTCAGVQKYVDEFFNEDDVIGFYNLSGQAVGVKISGN